MVFIDTGAFVSRYIKNDQYSTKSIETWLYLEKLNQPLYTSQQVVFEVITFFSRSVGNEYAARKGRMLYECELFSILSSSEEDELQAITLLERYRSEKVSFADCLSAVLMKKQKISTIFSFDQHFEYMGFTRIPYM